MINYLVLERELWFRDRNVEAVFCWLPTFEQVCSGEHTVTAVGNDAMAVNIGVDTAMADAAGEIASVIQLKYLGNMLDQFRRMEAIGNVPD